MAAGEQVMDAQLKLGAWVPLLSSGLRQNEHHDFVISQNHQRSPVNYMTTPIIQNRVRIDFE
jgi:hypothetical protein